MLSNALIVSSADKAAAYFAQLFGAASVGNITTLQTCAQARRALIERDFSLVLINMPLKDETGEQLACEISSKKLSQVILVAAREICDKVMAGCEDYGVMTIAKPVNKELFKIALGLAKSTHNKLHRMHADNEKLKQKIEDIRTVDRAKCILISYMNMDENEAHKYLEKRAMDMRSTKRAVAESILKTYEN